jgi:hypothetical protein
MLINYELKAIAFHNPKCGGNSLQYALDDLNFIETCIDTHYNYINFVEDETYIKHIKDKHTIRKFGKYRYFYSHQDANKEHMDTFFKFIFVRNPYRKLLSAYLYLRARLGETYYNTIRGLEENPEYFTDFNVFVKNYKNVNNISFFHAFICQYDQIIDFSGNIQFEFIGNIEHFYNDVIDIFTFLDIKKFDNVLNRPQNISKYEKEVTEYYNEETFYFVNEFFKKDFEIFSYKKYDTFEEFKINFKNDQYIECINNNENTKDDNIQNYYKIINYNEIMDKYKTISNGLIDELIKRCHYKINDLNILKNEIDNIEKKYLEKTKENEIIKNNIIEILIKEKKEKLSKNIKYCEKCMFKSYNSTAYNAHKYFCK